MVTEILEIIYLLFLSAFADRADRVTDDFTSGALFLMIAYGIYYKKLRILREKIRPKQ